MTPNPLDTPLTRRRLLGLAAAAGVAVIGGCDDGETPGTAATATPGSVASPSAAGATATIEPSALSCIVSPEQTEGPFFVDELLNRADIRPDPAMGVASEGVLLRLPITVQQVDGEACTPLVGALVDVWHCDAEGLYSDVEANGTAGQQFLRGYQLTDEIGACEFTTIYPGWYQGRTVHIHVKVRTDPDAQQGYEFTSQLYFDDETTDEVYAQSPYNARGERDTRNANDGIFGGDGEQMMLKLGPEADGYVGAINIGVRIG